MTAIRSKLPNADQNAVTEWQRGMVDGTIELPPWSPQDGVGRIGRDRQQSAQSRVGVGAEGSRLTATALPPLLRLWTLRQARRRRRRRRRSPWRRLMAVAAADVLQAPCYRRTWIRFWRSSTAHHPRARSRVRRRSDGQQGLKLMFHTCTCLNMLCMQLAEERYEFHGMMQRGRGPQRWH